MGSIRTMSISACFSKSGYAIIFIAAVACLYFSIAEGLFAWLLPDELVAHNGYKVHGWLGCALYYYLDTTINRVGAAVNVCGMATLASWIGTPYLGWVVLRLVFYALIPICLAASIKTLTQATYQVSLVASLAVCSAGYFIISHPTFYMFGLDLAIYATATFSFYLLVAWFPRDEYTAKNFTAFCVLYFMNLNSHEICLVLSGFFIPLYAWHQDTLKYPGDNKRKMLDRIKESLKRRDVQILVGIYIISALLTLLAPGMKIRQTIWPSTGTFTESLIHMILSFEEAAYHVSRSHMLLLSMLLLGICFGIGYARKCEGNAIILRRWLFLYVGVAPVIYLLITGFLLGTTPSLLAGSFRTDDFRVLESLIDFQSKIFQHGALAVRQNVFLYIGLCNTFFLLGYLLSEWIKHTTVIKRAMLSRSSRLSFGVIIILLFLDHPDAWNSFRMLHILNTGTDVVSEHGQKPDSIMQALLPDAYSQFHMLYNRPWHATFSSSAITIATDHYMRRHRFVPEDVLEPIYESMNDGYDVRKAPGWIYQIYDMYGVLPKQPCASFIHAADPKSNCYQTVGKVEGNDLLKRKQPKALESIIFSDTQNAILHKKEGGCAELRDETNNGEHFAIVNDVYLAKGLHYFVIDVKPSKASVYLFLLGKDTLMLPLQNLPVDNTMTTTPDDSMSLVFRQSEETLTSQKILLVVNNKEAQSVKIRWQHAKGGSTIYRGRKWQMSILCPIEHGMLVDKRKGK